MSAAEGFFWSGFLFLFVTLGSVIFVDDDDRLARRIAAGFFGGSVLLFLAAIWSSVLSG